MTPGANGSPWSRPFPWPRAPPTTQAGAAYDAAIARLADLAAVGARPLDEPLVGAEVDDEVPVPIRRTPAALYHAAVEVGPGVHRRRRRLPGGAGAALRHRSRCRALRPVPVAPPGQPQPLHVPAPPPRGRRSSGSSPEPLVTLRAGRVTSRPIAGTRRRGADDIADRRMAAELTEDPKERAEHVMLVDLARNDVGRVVTYGTETVEELMTLERYSHVMHLTSQVSGSLRPGLDAVDVLRATMPAGTVSGAPKVRAMEIIDDLEPAKRGPYAGVVGYIDFSGTLDAAIAIRTMLIGPDGRASVQAGAGIVADSDPAAEDLECRNKAAALLAAVPGARRLACRPAKRISRKGSLCLIRASPTPSCAHPRCRPGERRRPRRGGRAGSGGYRADAGRGRRRHDRAGRGGGRGTRRGHVPPGPAQRRRPRPRRRSLHLDVGPAARRQGRGPGPGHPSSTPTASPSTPTPAGATPSPSA